MFVVVGTQPDHLSNTHNLVSIILETAKDHKNKNVPTKVLVAGEPPKEVKHKYALQITFMQYMYAMIKMEVRENREETEAMENMEENALPNQNDCRSNHIYLGVLVYLVSIILYTDRMNMKLVQNK